MYLWGNSFFKPLIQYESSHLVGEDNLAQIREMLARGDNVFLLANHQVRGSHASTCIHAEMHYSIQKYIYFCT
jgi:hypothetical protein